MERRNLQRGGWLAQQGDAGLRFSGLPSNGTGKITGVRQVPLSSARAPSPNHSFAADEGKRQSMGQKPQQATAGASATCGASVNDALDELLLHARITLKHLESLSGRAAGNAGPGGPGAKVEPRGQAKGKSRAPNGERKAKARPPDASFWKPKCKSHLWSETSSPDSTFGGNADDADDASTASSVSGDDTTPEDWELLRRVQYYSPAGGRLPKAETAGLVGRSRPKVGAVGPTGLKNSHASYPSADASTKTPAHSGPSRLRPEGRPPRPEEAPDRARAAGFRFGGFGPAGDPSTKAGANGAGMASTVTSNPEAEVTLTLTSALRNSGADAARQVLKRLLLRWHPDKALQGDGPEAQAAQAEATRVLRFILQERERLCL